MNIGMVPDYLQGRDPELWRARIDQGGLWVDGRRGWYAAVAVVDMATDRGFMLNDYDTDLYAWARAGGLTSSDADPRPETWPDLVRDAERWLAEVTAPDGYAFGWHDGDFVLMPESWWTGE